jgi:hypothetical protein
VAGEVWAGKKSCVAAGRQNNLLEARSGGVQTKMVADGRTGGWRTNLQAGRRTQRLADKPGGDGQTDQAYWLVDERGGWRTNPEAGGLTQRLADEPGGCRTSLEAGR